MNIENLGDLLAKTEDEVEKLKKQNNMLYHLLIKVGEDLEKIDLEHQQLIDIINCNYEKDKDFIVLQVKDIKKYIED